MVKETAKTLRIKQKELMDEFILQPEKMEKIMRTYSTKRKEFHQYSLGNIILANHQLYSRKGETIDLLAPYKKWGKVNRYVRKGEKAIYILAPILKEIEDDETGEVETKMWFKRVPVFDLSQTDGEKFEEDYTVNNSDLSFKDIVGKVKNIPVLESEKEITRGYTDGEKIWVSKHISDTEKICTLFHELIHYKLHFGKDRYELDKGIKELEAEAGSFMICSALGITNDESSTYIKSWAGDNSVDEIEGRGSKLIRITESIIKELGLDSFVMEV